MDNSYLMKDERTSRGLSFGGKLYAYKDRLLYISKKGEETVYPYSEIAAVNDQRGTLAITMDDSRFICFYCSLSSVDGWVKLIKGIKNGDVELAENASVEEIEPEEDDEEDELDEEFEALFSDDDF